MPGTESSGDASSTSAKAPLCGDTVVDDGEACDDGNDVDTDACTSACMLAVCGDGFVQDAVEECDDQNADEADGCTSACLLPTCSDAAVNGGETDIDCGGGMCPKCAVSQTCSGPNDCETGLCEASMCVHAKNCAEFKSIGQPTGEYTIDPDGGGAVAPFEVWCEQDYAGGGWTLVLKIDGSKSSFVYADPKWTDPMSWMPDPDLDRSETKLQSFGTVQASEVLIGMEAPIKQGALQLKYIQFNLQSDPPSLASVFQLGAYVATSNPYAEWTALVPVGSLQPNCKRQGFNAHALTNPHLSARVRIGILGNNENNCDTPNSFIGVGASPDGDTCDGGYTTTTGNGAVCSADLGKQDVAGFAVVYVR
jgi:cysteine-rich repeat protein